MQFIFLLCGLLIASQLSAQDQPKGVVEGNVVDEVTGEPVRRATVMLMGQRAAKPPESVVVQSQADGRFRFEGLEPGNYNLTARKNGYLNPGGRAMVTPFPLTSGQQKTGLTIKLTAQGIISGRVFDEEGDPVQGAQVQVLQRRKVGGKQQWQPTMSNSTNDRGEYRLPNLSAGEYAVSASYWDQGVQMNAHTQVRQAVYATTYYPNGIDLNSAQAVTVQKGGETGGIDIGLRKETAFRVRVRVEGVSAELLPQTNVNLIPRDSAQMHGPRGFGSRQVEPGLYELMGVRAGSWFVQAQTFQQGAEPLIGMTPIEVSTADLTDVVVRVGAGQQVSGAFAFEGTPPVKMNWREYNVRLVATDGRSYGAGRLAVTEDGVFTLRNNMPGKYLIDVQGPRTGKTYLASIKVGNEEYFGKELDLTSGVPGPLKIIYRNDAAMVSGTLEGAGGGAEGASGMAVVVPVETHLRRLEYMVAVPIRPDGTFTFGSVRPGEYLVCHMLGDHQALYENGEPPKEAMEAAVRLKVDPNGTHSVQVKAAGPR